MIYKFKGYEFDDVLLTPMASTVNSRDEVDLSVEKLGLKIPIIASPMKGIVSPDLIIELMKMGGIGILHRFYSTFADLENDVFRIYEHFGTGFGISLGLDDMKTLELCGEVSPRIVCVDVANGYLQKVKNFVSLVKDCLGDSSLVMAGNISTADGMRDLENAGADIIRVGIGTGHLCTTRIMTGVGKPQLTALEECWTMKKPETILVADGGIRNSGDIVKSLAFGADAVMIGTMFGHAQESSHNGLIYGMASRKLQEEYYHSVKSVEGIDYAIQKTATLEEIVTDITWNMKSAFTYLNARNIAELKQNVYNRGVSIIG